MKSIIIKGTLIVFSLGILVFIIYYVLDFLMRVWTPPIQALFGKDYIDSRDYLIPLLTILFTIIVIFIVGFIFSRKRFVNHQSRLLGRIPIVNWFLGQKRMPSSIHDMPGALVRFSEGSYYIAAVVGHQKILTKEGKIEIWYKIYSPSAPIPWTGLPIIFAKREEVIPLKITFGEVYGITTSFGRSAPAVMEELDLEKVKL